MTERSALNTDKELWRERPGDYYADSLHVTENGAIGMNCGGTVYVMPIREWHGLKARVAELEAALRSMTTSNSNAVALLTARNAQLAEAMKERERLRAVVEKLVKLEVPSWVAVRSDLFVKLLADLGEDAQHALSPAPPAADNGGAAMKTYWHNFGGIFQGEEKFEEVVKLSDIALEWTKEKPAVTGWYWWKNSDVHVDAQVIRLEWSPLDSTVLRITKHDGLLAGLMVEDIKGEWAGPLDPPKERP